MSRSSVESQGHGYYWSKAKCQKHSLMDGTEPIGLPRGIAPALPLVRKGAGWHCWCATGLWPLATGGQGSTCTCNFCSHFQYKPQIVNILGYPAPKIREEVTGAECLSPRSENLMWVFWVCSSCCLEWGSQGCPGTVPSCAGAPGSSGSFCLPGMFDPSLSTVRPSASSPALQGSSGEHAAVVPWYHLASPVLPQSQQARAHSRQESGQGGRS